MSGIIEYFMQHPIALIIFGMFDILLLIALYIFDRRTFAIVMTSMMMVVLGVVVWLSIIG